MKLTLTEYFSRPRDVVRQVRTSLPILPGVTADHTIQVTSFGGSGTSLLYRFLRNQEITLPQTTIPYKHQVSPPSDRRVREGFRALYLFSDPRNATLSVFRRGYQQNHFRRMNNNRAELNLNLDSWDIDDFLKYGHDLFNMEKQFNEWTTSNRRYPIMTVRHNTLWGRLPEVFAFLGLPSRYTEDFPDYSPRESDWTDLEPTNRKQITQIYEDLLQDINSHPNLLVR